MANGIKDCFLEYDEQKTPEARFVYALDKLEPIFELFDDINMQSYKRLKVTATTNRKPRDEAVKNYPTMKRFLDVGMNYFVERDAFHKE